MNKETLKRLYNNQLATNLVNIADKDTVKLVKTTIKTFLDKIISKNKNGKGIKVITSAEDRDAVKDVIKLALSLDDTEVITNSMLDKAVVSACQHKFVTESKGVKVGNWSYSVSNFLKSLNASIVGKIEKSSFAD